MSVRLSRSQVVMKQKYLRNKRGIIGNLIYSATHHLEDTLLWMQIHLVIMRGQTSTWGKNGLYTIFQSQLLNSSLQLGKLNHDHASIDYKLSNQTSCEPVFINLYPKSNPCSGQVSSLVLDFLALAFKEMLQKCRLLQSHALILELNRQIFNHNNTNT